MIYLGWLSTVNHFDWSTNTGVGFKQKRAMPNGSIVIHCLPENLKITWNMDFPNGIYIDPYTHEYFLMTPAMDACRGTVAGDQPILLVQKSVVGQDTSYTIFICAAAKSTNIVQPNLTAYSMVRRLSMVVVNTMWGQRGGKQWNLGPQYALTNMIMFDTMFLAALYSIAQQAASYVVYNPLTPSPLHPALTNLWVTTFQSGTAFWNNPSESYQ